MARRPSSEKIQAYHDDELGFLARRIVGRQIERSAEARQELESLALVGDWVRESQVATAAPDLWAGIARELPARERPQIREEKGESPLRWLSWLTQPLTATVAAAAVAAVALVFALTDGETTVADVVQYLDAGDNAVMLLQVEDEATIIWVMDPVQTDTSSRGTRAFI